MEQAFVVTAVVAVTELIKRIRIKDTAGAVTIVSAAVVGGLAGFFGVEGLSVVSGIVAGLSAAGVVTVATRVG